MTSRRGLITLFLAIAVVSMVMLVPNCSEIITKKFYFGETIPDARVLVKLATPMSKVALFSRMEQAVRLAGFSELRGVARTPDIPESVEHPSGFLWYRYATSKKSQGPNYSVHFDWPYGVEWPSTVRFIFYNNRLDGFQAEEWILFYHWKDDVLPRIFPAAEITVTHHPAEFTHAKDLMRVSEATGISLPDREKARYEQWRAGDE